MNKIVRLVFIIALTISFSGCVPENCNQDCFTPPAGFYFELVDKNSSENLFTNGTFQPNDISVVNVLDNSNVNFSFEDEDNRNIISIYSLGWQTEKVEVLLMIKEREILKLYVDVERVSENCCSFSRYNEIRITNAQYQLDSQKDIYTIFIEL